MPIVRRDPVTTAESVLSSAGNEGRERLLYAVEQAPPGTVFRWDKMLSVANRTIEPTEEAPDPLRVVLDMDELKKAFRTLYKETTSTSSEGVKLCRKFLPLMYDKHSLDRGRRVSQREREERRLSDESYAYGELDFEVFIMIFEKIRTAYGLYDKTGIFYDLGCGVGNLVYAGAFIGNFVRVGGVEIISSLLERGSKRQGRWVANQAKYPRWMQDIDIDFTNGNFLESDIWIDATFILLHWTAFSKDQIRHVSNMMNACREGTFVVAFTHPVPNSDFELLIKDSCQTSWGEAEFYVQEKQTPAQKGAAISIDLRPDKDIDAQKSQEEEGMGDSADDMAAMW